VCVSTIFEVLRSKVCSLTFELITERLISTNVFKTKKANEDLKKISTKILKDYFIETSELPQLQVVVFFPNEEILIL